MSVDYDLVIIGYTLAGIRAALQAVRYRARVALVEQNCQPRFSRHHAISKIGRTLQHTQRANQLQWFESPIQSSPVQLPQVNRWIDAIAQSQQEIDAPEKLEAAGIEFLSGSGEFCRKPQMGFTVNGRVLQSRAFLIAIEYRPAIPDIPGLRSINYLVASSILSKPLKSLAIIGNDPIGVELAQHYARLGIQVTLIVRQAHVLSIADSEMGFLVQAQLEAEGVRVLNTLHIAEIVEVQKKKRIQAENETIEVDEVLMATSWEPQTETLNLEAMGIKQPLRVNERLQTSHARVYWCAHPVPTIAQHQADIAVQNALFLPIFKANHRDVAQAVYTDPEFAWVGMTESQATNEYGKDVIVLRQPFYSTLKAQIAEEFTGLCKIIVRRNGQILGAHIVGTNARELITTIALAMQENLGIQSLDRISHALTYSEIFRNAVQEWEAFKRQRGSIVQDLQASYLAWQRSRVQ
jgi:pyruvate/2-oxoglutarate dehydrogenase complex dihydrolipoamide dehydrogenase (E3) component